MKNKIFCAESVKQAIKLRVQQSMLNPKEQTPEQAKEIAEKLLNFELEEGYNCPTCGKNFKKVSQTTAIVRIFISIDVSHNNSILF